MGTAVVKANIPALSMSEDELMSVLKNSLYPGAGTESIKMVLGYCKAAGLDPMHKPVHIVPMYDSKSGGMRDVIMPGIGSYRTQAARSGEYAGVSEPEFGPDVTEDVGGTRITYPSWCKVTIKRILKNGMIAEFSATERWQENYATKGGKEKSIAPNAMWYRRPYAQLAKCAEAQALRKAFPEFGAQATADEMEGKSFDDSTVIDHGTGEILQKPAEKPAYTTEQFAANLSKWQSGIDAGKLSPEKVIAAVSSKYTISEAQKASILAMRPTPEPEPESPMEKHADFLAGMDGTNKDEPF